LNPVVRAWSWASSGAVLTLLGVLTLGCGADGAPEQPDPAEGYPVSEDAGPLQAEAWVTFHRLERPVRVRRTISLPPGEQEERSVGEVLLELALLELVEGPTQMERETGISSFFSSETRDILKSVEVEAGRVVLDFHDFRPLLPGASSSAGSEAFLAELNGTVFANSPAVRVEYRLEGSCDEFWAFLQRACTIVVRPEEF